jgi:hypothetical protein
MQSSRGAPGPRTAVLSPAGRAGDPSYVVYVSQQNLLEDGDSGPVDHPSVSELFEDFAKAGIAAALNDALTLQALPARAGRWHTGEMKALPIREGMTTQFEEEAAPGRATSGDEELCRAVADRSGRADGRRGAGSDRGHASSEPVMFASPARRARAVPAITSPGTRPKYLLTENQQPLPRTMAAQGVNVMRCAGFANAHPLDPFRPAHLRECGSAPRLRRQPRRRSGECGLRSPESGASRCFRPSIANLYLGPFGADAGRHPDGMVHLTEPDLDRYPRFAEALEQRLDLERRRHYVLLQWVPPR